MKHQTKQRAVELAIKDAARDLTVPTYDEDGFETETSVEVDDLDVERIARAAIEAIERWEKHHAPQDARSHEN